MNEKQAKSAIKSYDLYLRFYLHRWNESMLNGDQVLMKGYSKELERLRNTIQSIKNKNPEYFL